MGVQDTWKAKKPGSEKVLFLSFFEGWVGFRCRFDTVTSDLPNAGSP